jgi:UDP-glucose 4-epimerase
VGAIHEALGERLISSTNLFVHAMRAVVCEGAPPLTVFGTDYDTADGSAVRDYVHVVDVARAHICAYQTYLHERDLVSYFHSMPRIVTLNIGSSAPTSVLQVLHTFETATGVAIPHELGPRRAGDVPVMRCDASLAHTHLSWRATLGLDEACRDALAAARRRVSAGDMSPA